MGVAALLAIACAGPDPAEAQQRIPGWGRVAPPGGHQNDLQLIRPTGGPVVPMFEGWFTNPDGTRQLCFGYFNTNSEEVFEIPVGPRNRLEPAEFDGLQPTHFLPVPPGGRRHYCVLSVTVPADWGDRDVVWTLVDRSGQEYSVPGRTRYEAYHLEELEQGTRESSAPAVRMGPSGRVVRGRTGDVAGPLMTRVGRPLRLTIRVRSDNPFDEGDDTPVGFRWHKYQGPGEVVFEAAGGLDTAGTRTIVEAEAWTDSEDGWGKAATEATFDRAGRYRLLLQAYNDRGRRIEPRDLEFFCCWTNLWVDVRVGP